MPQHKMQIVNGVRYRPEDAPEQPPQQQSAEPDREVPRQRRRTTRRSGDAGDRDDA